MSALFWPICKGLIEKEPLEQRRKLLSFLPSSQLQKLQACTPISVLSALKPEDVLGSLHPSWAYHFVQQFHEKERPFFISLLPTSSQEFVKNLLQTKELPVLTGMGKSFLEQRFLHKIIQEHGEGIGKKALPESKIKVLLDYDPSQITQIAFCLGLYDVAEEMRFIIDKQTLGAIESALSPAEWQILKNLQNKTDRLSFGRMASLKSSLEVPSKFRLLVEQHGLNRLAKALYGEHWGFTWHFTLGIEMKRASFISRFSTALAKPQLKELLQDQVLSVIRLLFPEKKKGDL